MSVARGLLRAAAALALAATLVAPVQSGGPLSLVNHQPVVYANGGTSLTLNLDQGPLGTRTNAQANALVQNAIGLWNGVSTSTLRISIGAPLPIDYTTANYTNVYNRWTDGLNPVIYDSDGSLTDLLFGTGAKASVLGFAGSAYYTSGSLAGKYAEGQAVLNGWLGVSDVTWTIVLAHEIGHLFGLDHSQLDGTQGLPTSDFVLMYPVAYRALQSLHEDDIAAVTALYPAANVNSIYGQLNGTFTTAGGSPILGANIWAREVSTGDVFSVVSDYLTQGNGYFRLLLPAGTYTLNAESISTNYYGGSGVGPYSDSNTSASFLPPHPITPVALGGASPRSIVISAGCIATATFRLDGTGGVTGNCGGVTPATTSTALASSANPAIAGAGVTFTATVTGSAPTGTVDFKDGGVSLSGCGAVALTGVGNTRSATCSSALAAGTHSIVAAYGGDGGNAASNSVTLSQVINPVITTSTNVALASAGAVATASSTLGGGYPVSAVNNNERTGAGWGNGSAGWRDGTNGVFPDWVQIAFNGVKTIDRVVVYTIQNNWTNPVEPTDTLTFSLYGVTAFSVQTWNGSAWVTQSTISGNNLVKRTVTFPAVSTDRIRVNVNGAADGNSRIIEIEAWGATSAPQQKAATSTALASSANPAIAGANVTFTATVTGSAPTGTVNFRDGAVSIGGCSAVPLAGSGNSRSATCSSSALAAGTHSIVAAYGGDGGNNASTSATLSQVINPIVVTTSTNVALASAGAVATASSTLSSGYPVTSVNNNVRTGAGWGNGSAGWRDATNGVFPDWVQIAFNGVKTIDRVVVYTMQNNWTSPVEPTDTLTFSLYGVTAFTVQTWNGSAWVTQATITGNNLVKRTVTFPAVSTDRIRVNVNGAADGNSRIMEIEAWGK